MTLDDYLRDAHKIMQPWGYYQDGSSIREPLVKAHGSLQADVYQQWSWPWSKDLPGWGWRVWIWKEPRETSGWVRLSYGVNVPTAGEARVAADADLLRYGAARLIKSREEVL